MAIEVLLAVSPPALLPSPLRIIQTFDARRADWQRLTTGDSYLGYKLRPDVSVDFPFERGTIPIRTTSYGQSGIGFRDIGTRPPFEAIVIGDSFVFCDEVPPENCWVRRFSDATGVSTATLGVSGYSTLAEARMLKRYGPAFGPRLVLLAIFPNDLIDNVGFDRWIKSGTDDLQAWREQRRQRKLIRSWLGDHSTVYRLLSAVLRARKRSVHRVQEGNVNLVLRFDPWWLATVRAPERHPGWALMQQGLLDMRQTAADMHARFVVVIFPTKEDAYWNITQRYVPHPEQLGVDRLPRLIDRFLADHDMLGCDVTGEIREEAQRGRQLYHRVSGHFNAQGNSFAAEAVRRCLVAKRVLGTGSTSR